jgi:hypothetical protein
METNKPPSETHTQRLKASILGWGADLVGVADTEPLRDLKTIPADLLTPFPRAVAIAVQLPVHAFEMIVDSPTPIYSAIYQTANKKTGSRACLSRHRKSWTKKNGAVQ